MSLVYMQSVHGRLSTYERLVNTLQNPKAVYACINQGQAAAPQEIAGQAICLSGDIGDFLKEL